MSDVPDPLVRESAILRLEQNDVVVLRVNVHLRDSQVEEIKRELSERLLGIRVIALRGVEELSVIRQPKYGSGQ